MRKVVVFIQCCYVMRTKVGQSYVRYYGKCCLKKGDIDVGGDQQICQSSLTIDILGNQATQRGYTSFMIPEDLQ